MCIRTVLFLNMIDIFSKYRIYRRFYHIFHDVFYFYLIKLNALHISSYQIMLFLDIFIAYLLCIFRASVKIGDKIHVFCQKKNVSAKNTLDFCMILCRYSGYRRWQEFLHFWHKICILHSIYAEFLQKSLFYVKFESNNIVLN